MALMKWTSDPPNRWTAIYRLTVLCLLIWLALLQRQQTVQLETVSQHIEATAGPS